METKTKHPTPLTELQREIFALQQENMELYAENERLYRRCHPWYWLRMALSALLPAAAMAQEASE